jgi:hypothetical protein
MTQNFLKVPTFTDNQDEQNRLTANAINNILDGKLNSTGEFSIDYTTTSTTVIDARVGANSVILWSPLTEHAANENQYVYLSSIGEKQFVLGHRAHPHGDDLQYRYVVIG